MFRKKTHVRLPPRTELENDKYADMLWPNPRMCCTCAYIFLGGHFYQNRKHARFFCTLTKRNFVMAKKIRCWADGENLGIYTHAVDQGAGSVATRVLRKLPGEVNFLFDVKVFS